MSAGDDGGRTAVEQARQRAHVEWQKAVYAAELAARHEKVAASGLALPRTEFHRRMAKTHRRLEERHWVSSRIHFNYAQHLECWARGDAGASRPGLVTAVASTAGSQSAALVLRGRSNPEALVATSDATSRAAHDLERTFAEGPAHDAMQAPVPVRAAGSRLRSRWPHYGPALHELGVAEVAAVGLHTTGICLGSLTIFDPQPSRPSITALTDIAEAVVHTVLLAPDALDNTEGLPTMPDLEEENFQSVLHQAAGKIHADSGCGVDAALALIRAHALSEDRTAAAVAHDVVRGVLRLM